MKLEIAIYELYWAIYLLSVPVAAIMIITMYRMMDIKPRNLNCIHWTFILSGSIISVVGIVITCVVLSFASMLYILEVIEKYVPNICNKLYNNKLIKLLFKERRFISIREAITGERLGQ